MAENSTDDNSKLVDMDDLNAFEKDFFTPNNKDIEDDSEEVEETPENEDDALATEADTEDEESEDETSEDADEAEDEDEESEPEVKPTKKKNSAKERINELTRKVRETERRETELLRRLEAIEARKTEDTKSEDKVEDVRERLAPDAPNPDATDKNGDPIYKLGEFDPKFIADLTEFMVNKQMSVAQAKAAEDARAAEAKKAQDELRKSWLEKVEAVEEELPDLREKLASMDEAFNGIDPKYGEFLATAIMSCDHGPEIMYYLSQNIGEAQTIVASGPAAASLAIGRLDAKLSKPVQEEKRNTKKVSEAPKPPEARVRGSGVRSRVSADTDDLDAFEREFFKAK